MHINNFFSYRLGLFYFSPQLYHIALFFLDPHIFSTKKELKVSIDLCGLESKCKKERMTRLILVADGKVLSLSPSNPRYVEKHHLNPTTALCLICHVS